MLRKDLVDKYGVDVASIKTLKDLTPALEAFSAEGLPYTYLTQRTAMFYRYYIDSFDCSNRPKISNMHKTSLF